MVGSSMNSETKTVKLNPHMARERAVNSRSSTGGVEGKGAILHIDGPCPRPYHARDPIADRFPPGECTDEASPLPRRGGQRRVSAGSLVRQQLDPAQRDTALPGAGCER